MSIDYIIRFLKANVIIVALCFSGLLMLASASLMITNQEKIDNAVKTEALAEKARFELLFSHLNIVRDVDVAIRGYALIREDRLLYIKPDQLKSRMESVFYTLDSILREQHYEDTEGRNALKEYQAYIRMLVTDFDEMSQLLRAGNDSAFMEILKLDKGSQLGISMAKAQDKVIAFEEETKRKAVGEYKSATKSNIIIGVAMAVLGIPSIIMLIVRLRREAKGRDNLLRELESNNRKYLFDSGGSVDTINAEVIVEKSIENFREATDFVTQLSKGDYSVNWRGLNAENESLNPDNLAGKLIQLRKNLNAFKTEDEKRIWANEGLTKFSEVVRNHQHSVEALSLEVIKYLTKYLRAQQGGLFVLQGEDEPCLNLTACYAFERKKYIQKTIKIGEGLIGQAFLEGQTIFLKEIPDGYIQITSGLGDASPNSVVIVPLKYNEKIEAVLELASFQVFEKYQIEFIEKAGEFVASALLNTKASQQMKHLLSQSQRQTEDMRSAEEELRQNMEEMEATQEEMNRRGIEQRQEIQRLNEQHEESIASFKRLSLVADNTDNSVVITDAKGNIEYVNNGFTKMTGYVLAEVMGKKPESFLYGKDTNADTVKRIREKLLLHQPCYEEILNYDKNGNEYWISLAINPISEEGKLTKFVSIYSDVTVTKLQAQEFTAQVEAIGRSNSIVSFDLKGMVQSANKNFLDVMGYTMEEIISKHHRMFVFEEESNTEEYAQMWKDLGEGKFVSGEFKRRTKDGKEIWLNGTYTAIMDLQGNPYKVMKFAQNITAQKELDKRTQELNRELKIKDKETQERAIELTGVISAINSTLANIEFTMEGDIITANDNFLKEMGYSLSELEGKHHKLFVDKEYAKSKEYAEFWDDLNFGKAQIGEVKRVTKAGDEIWFSASYTPVMDVNNKPFKVIKFAQNITPEKIKSLEYSAQVKAIGQSNSIVSFDMNGIVQSANDNFLNRMGYELSDVMGMHHKIFVPADGSTSEQYRKMWRDLNKGKFISGEFRRKTKTGEDVWLNGVYAPIVDLQGKPYKVMKFAQDITIQKQLAQESQLQNEELRAIEEELRQNVEEITAVQEDMQRKALELNGIVTAVNATLVNIEFDMKGNIVTANDNFLDEMGYGLRDIVGKHHKILVDAEYARSREYSKFWEDLNFGKAQIGEVKRYTKNGSEIWFSASYTPVVDANNQPFKVIKFAQNITHQKQLSLDYESQMSAIDKSYAVIEFDMQGNILKANGNFLSLMEYGIDEIRGKHHRIFVEKKEAESNAYEMFWTKLKAGEYIINEFTRISRSGKEVKIKGSYSPIKDMSGKPYKIVKYALEIKQLELSV